MLVVVCFFLLRCFFISIATSSWAPFSGNKCHPSSNSSYLESMLLDNHNIRIPHIHLLSNCFYWMSGSLNLGLNSSRRNVSHHCHGVGMNNSDSARTKYRDLIQNFLRWSTGRQRVTCGQSAKTTSSISAQIWFRTSH